MKPAKQLTRGDELLLAQQDMKTLTRWWALLTNWGWPRELPDPEPRNDYANGRRDAIYLWIQEAVGLRECLREWNREMTDEQFNDFWRGEYEGHAPSAARYMNYLRGLSDD